MSTNDTDDFIAPEPPLDPGLRFWLILLCIGCLLFAAGSAPLFLAMLAMSFGAPGSQWGLLQIFWIGLPALILTVGVAAGWAVARNRLKALWIAVGMLFVDVVGLGILWPQG